MYETPCRLDGRRERLVAFVYGEDSPADRSAFERHLGECPACRQELAGLSSVRSALREWMPPVPGRGLVRHAPVLASGPRGWGGWGRLADIPAWARTAAALVVLGISLGVAGRIASLEVRYGGEGLSIRTGRDASRGVEQAVSAPPAREAAASATVPPAQSPWTEDLSRMEERLRAEIVRAAADAGDDTASRQARDEALVQRVRALIAESEARQQRELALRIADVVQEGQVRRLADLQRIDRSLGAIESSNRAYILRHNEAINNLAVRVGLAGRD
jgi:hypothetical protein